MNTNEENLDRLIERYTSGAMSPTEERAFLSQAGHDPNLRELLNAEQAIQSAFTKERTLLFTQTGGAYQRFLARTASVANPAAATVPAGGAALGGVVKYLAVILGTVGLSVGAFFVGRSLSESTAPAKKDAANAVVKKTAESPVRKIDSVQSNQIDLRPRTTAAAGTDTADHGSAPRHTYVLRRHIPTVVKLHQQKSLASSPAEKKLPRVTVDGAKGKIDVRDENKK